ncbi:uncharacterized protein LOC110007141 [Amborella trichopoda]|uniref:uncharacterized protein LOC110007141 n=1 Tax=Amborella trichopoda TaxID=13333 RepID=UPI0009BE4A6A|nr:uncharacterized protein LOC110007141 [Amborella trichopoda]|eukprot:XP_020522086.1 uncharacterized protein LOC110007141 [Amborella trichopoda]
MVIKGKKGRHLAIWALMVAVWLLALRPQSLTNFHPHRFKDLRSIQGTPVLGHSIDKFRDHLRCISESGRWVYDPMPRQIPWNHVAEQYSERCEERHPGLRGEGIAGTYYSTANWTVREELKWVWQSSNSCPTLPVDRNDWCKLLGAKGNLMIVGDSINHQVQWSLTNALIGNFSNDPRIVKDEYPVCRTCQGFPLCEDVLGAGRGINVSFIRNDKLSAVIKPSENREANFYQWPWLDYIDLWEIKYLLLNRGAHYEPDHAYVESLNSTLFYLR